MGLRGMRVRKSPLVRVLYAEATRPFPVNAKGAGPQTTRVERCRIDMLDTWLKGSEENRSKQFLQNALKQLTPQLVSSLPPNTSATGDSKPVDKGGFGRVGSDEPPRLPNGPLEVFKNYYTGYF